jgi:hypothetical protein
MSDVVHLWLANPASPTELSTLLAALEKACPESHGKTSVVYEKEELSVSDMAVGFGDGPNFARTSQEKASSVGHSTAFALIGARMGGAVAVSEVAALIYLGHFDPNE